MNATTCYRAPNACTDSQRGDFAHLVRQGFPGAQNLEARIRAAKLLAFYYPVRDTLRAVAAIKAPDERSRHDLFKLAAAPVDGSDYQLELGWVFVAPAYRGRQIAEDLCRQLLVRVPASPLFATTRAGNEPMMRILEALGFARVGRPFPRRDNDFLLYLRSH